MSGRCKSPSGCRVCDPETSLSCLKEVSVTSTMSHSSGTDNVDAWVKVNSGYWSAFKRDGELLKTGGEAIAYERQKVDGKQEDCSSLGQKSAT